VAAISVIPLALYRNVMPVPVWDDDDDEPGNA